MSVDAAYSSSTIPQPAGQGYSFAGMSDWTRFAGGAGASARQSIGITVFTGMIASTCLAVLFVPPFFVVARGFEEWLQRRRKPPLAEKPAS